MAVNGPQHRKIHFIKAVRQMMQDANPGMAIGLADTKFFCDAIWNKCAEDCRIFVERTEKRNNGMSQEERDFEVNRIVKDYNDGFLSFVEMRNRLNGL